MSNIERYYAIAEKIKEFGNVCREYGKNDIWHTEQIRHEADLYGDICSILAQVDLMKVKAPMFEKSYNY